MKNLAILIIFIWYSPIVFNQQLNKELTLNIGENFRLYPSNVNQWEVSIVNHPSNPNVMFASSNALTLNPFFISEGIYVTTNAGVSWRGNDTCTGAPILLHGGDPGIVIDNNEIFILTRKGFSSGIYSHYSTDYGLTWSDQKIISNDDISPERAGLVSDVNPFNIYYGRTYVVWVKQSPPFPLTFVFTDNSAQNWSSPQQINNPIQRSAGGEIAMGLDGYVYVCWSGLTDVSPFTEDFVGLASTSNGGTSWQVTENVFDINGISGLLVEKGNIRVNGLPRIAIDTSSGARNGWIYIVTGQKNLSPAGIDPDIILYRSTDDGQTWSQGIRVNQDLLNNGKFQLFPAINIDEFGGINIIFYDDRNTTIDSLGVFLARSDDGGNSWQEFEISDHNFKPTPIAGFQGKMGDNIGITSANGKLWPMWMDNSTGNYQIWIVPIEISTIDVEEKFPLVENFYLEQNYPNPFNPTTVIKWQSAESSWQTLKVYDVMGNEIVTLVNEYRSGGNNDILFDAATYNLPSGIYLYKLQIGSFTDTKKMMLIK